MQAAVYGMTYFQHYLITRKFRLYTDHKPLCKLSSTHVKTLNRQQIKMTELSPEIRYDEWKNNTVADFLSRYHGLGAEEKKTEVREYSSKHQGLGIAHIDASAPRIRALQLLDSSLEPMIRHEPNAKECRVVEDQLKPTNMKKHLLHVRKGIVYITNQTRQGFIDDPDDYAFKVGMTCLTTNKIIAPKGFRKEIITEAHNSKFSGHGGRFKMHERLRQDFWCPHMDKDIKEHIDQCEPCQTTTDKGKPPDGPITGLPITSGPSQRIHADLFGPLQNSERGNMYILVITDAFTKMAQLTPLNGKDVTTVTKAMMNDMYTFGVPRTVFSDQGPEFLSQMQNLLFNSLNIDRKVTTGYHPRCNSAAEQFNKIMISNKSCNNNNKESQHWIGSSA
jgi:hypothetical protein